MRFWPHDPRAESEHGLKDPKEMPGETPPTDVPPKPHEFPEYEDMPTDVHDEDPPKRRTPSDESADITTDQ
jgi:hypothetical protein